MDAEGVGGERGGNASGNASECCRAAVRKLEWLSKMELRRRSEALRCLAELKAGRNGGAGW